jgi:hypothetical protein
MRISKARTMKVYGRDRAILTIHMSLPRMQLTCQSPWLRFYSVLAGCFGYSSYYVVCTRRLDGTRAADFGRSIASTLEELEWI